MILGLKSSQIIYISKGVIVTLSYSIISILFGFILGCMLAILKISNNNILRQIANLYTSIFRGTPLLVQLSVIYFGLPNILHVTIPIFTAGILALSLNSAAYISEIVRMGFNSIDKGQWEGAQCLGISKYNTLKDIILPQVMRNILPSLANETIDLIKESAIISIIGGEDIIRRANLVASETFNYFGPMIFAAGLYYTLVNILGYIFKKIE